MYKIYVGKPFLYTSGNYVLGDGHGKYYGENGECIHNPTRGKDRIVINPKIVREMNKADSLSFTIFPNNQGYDSLSRLTPGDVIVTDEEDFIVFRGRILNEVKGWYNEKQITCESDFALFNDTIVRPYEFTGSVLNYFSYLITQHNNQTTEDKRFTVGRVTVTDPNNTIVRANSGYPTTMSELQDKLIGSLGGYMIVRREGGVNYIDYLSDSSGTSSQVIELGQNLLSMKQTVTGDSIYTGLIPLGAKTGDGEERLTIESVNGGLDYIVDSDAAELYGNIFTVEVWDDVTVASNLLQKARRRLEELSTALNYIELTAADLHLIDSSIDEFGFMEYVTVNDSAHGVSGLFLVTKKVIDLQNPESCMISMGKSSKTSASASSRAAGASGEIKKVSDKAINYTTMEAAIKTATDLITGADGGCIKYHYDANGHPTEMLIMDAQTEEAAERIWRFNVNGWGFSSDGGQTYRLAATMNGEIVADFITAGGMSAARITSGTLDPVRIPNLAAEKITSGTLDPVRIPNLAAEKITSGTLDPVRIPNLAAEKITSGTLDPVRIPQLSADKISVGGDPLTERLVNPNLLVGSGERYDANTWKMRILGTNPYLVAGKTYTITMRFKPAANVDHISVYLSQGISIDGWQAEFDVDTYDLQTQSKTFVCHYAPGYTPSDNPKNALVELRRYPDDGTVTGNTIIEWIKIEEGETATQWVPNPADNPAKYDVTSGRTVIDGGVVTTGLLKSANSDFYVNLDTGATELKRVTISGGSIDIDTDSQTNDLIKLAYGDWEIALSPLQVYLYNNVKKYELKLQAGGIFALTNGVRNWTIGHYDDNTTGLWLYQNGQNDVYLASDLGLSCRTKSVVSDNLVTVADTWVNGPQFTAEKDGYYWIRAWFRNNGNYNLAAVRGRIMVNGNQRIYNGFCDGGNESSWYAGAAFECTEFAYLSTGDIVRADLWGSGSSAYTYVSLLAVRMG